VQFEQPLEHIDEFECELRESLQRQPAPGGLKRKANAILLYEQKRCLTDSIGKDISILHMVKDQLLGYFVFRR